MATSYQDDTLHLIERIPDHDDKVEETGLAFGYRETARLWKVSDRPWVFHISSLDPL